MVEYLLVSVFEVIGWLCEGCVMMDVSFVMFDMLLCYCWIVVVDVVGIDVLFVLVV